MPINSIVDNEADVLKSRHHTQDAKIEQLFQDIYSLKKELAQSKKEYNELYNYNSSIYFTLDTNCIIQSLNFNAAILLGIDRKLLINKLFLHFISHNSQATFNKSIEALHEEKLKQICDIELLQKGGNRRFVTIESTLLQNSLVRLCLFDNTKNHQLTNRFFELEKSLNLVNGLLQCTNDAIAALDDELNFKIVNKSFIDLFSKFFAIKVETGMNLIRTLIDFPELKLKIFDACQTAFEGNKASVLIENQSYNNEAYYCYEININLIINNFYKQNRLILQIKNLTEYKLTERIQHKQHADLANESKKSIMGEILSALAHEINQPLTAIIAYSRSCLFIINNKINNRESHNKLLNPLEQIAIQAEHAGDVIHSMKNLMRNGNSTFEETNINLIIKETLDILNFELLDFNLDIKLNLMSSPPSIMMNKIHIMQVVLNLARNSIEALQHNSEEKPELIFATNKSNDCIEVHVRDNGPGIPAEFKDKILKTYFTTKPQGTGIGLGICRSLIEGHGGKISITSHENKGAWFTFTIPITYKKLNDGKHDLDS